MRSGPSSTLKQLKCQFNQIQGNIAPIEDRKTHLFKYKPSTLFQSQYQRIQEDRNYVRASSAEPEIHYTPATSQLEEVRRDRDHLHQQCRELKQALESRNRIISELTKENQQLKEKLKHTNLPEGSRQDNKLFMDFLPFNAYFIDDNPHVVSYALKENKKSALNSNQARHYSPGCSKSDFYSYI